MAKDDYMGPNGQPMDVIPITGTEARVAARLCNFPTGRAELLYPHIGWLRANVAPILRSQKNSYVNLYGYASLKGHPDFNQKLSEDRVASVKTEVSGYANQVTFKKEIKKGEDESTLGPPEAGENWGYWRAVDIYVFTTPPAPGFKPAPPMPKNTSAKRIIHRFFSQLDTEIHGFQPDGPNVDKDIAAGIKFLIGMAVNGKEGVLLGEEDISARKTAIFPFVFRVVRVTFNQKIELGFIESNGVVMGTQTSSTTTIDYEWGPPIPFVEIIQKRRLTTYGSAQPSIDTREFIPRTQAEKMPFIVPPKP